ncbi:hypothetical protein BDZ45DRAFT_237813 [Acephala macrosclerotiorum]|nr:hypothetical protein BDZ45DRAFT_237813 [Acephala macrosclerotiorum]
MQIFIQAAMRSISTASFLLRVTRGHAHASSIISRLERLSHFHFNLRNLIRKKHSNHKQKPCSNKLSTYDTTWPGSRIYWAGSSLGNSKSLLDEGKSSFLHRDY